MPRPLPDQVVVVTGASSGIGRAAAVAFAQAGASVVCAARGRDALDEVVAEIRAAGGTALAVPTDVARWDQVESLAASAVKRFGRVDTWVNNASVVVYGELEETTPAEFARVIDVNLMGVVHGTYAALPLLRRAGGGTIVNVSSVLGARAVPLLSSYVASKFAVRGFDDAVRMELLRNGDPITVTTVLPSSIDTPFFAHARSRSGRQPRPIPPVYAPEVVASAIVRAAEHPTREVVVGGGGAALLWLQRLMPGALDRLMTLGGLMHRVQLSRSPDDGVDNLDGPVSGPGAVRGDWSGHVAGSSAYTALVGHHPAVTGALKAVVTGGLVRRLARR